MCKKPNEVSSVVRGLNKKPKTFLDVRRNGEKIQLYDRITDELLVAFEDEQAMSVFDYREKICAVVLSSEAGLTTIQYVRHADIHRHSGFSFLDGGNTIGDLVRKTEYAGGIADHGGMYGVLTYYKAMKKAGKLPIIGFEAYAETIDGKKGGNHLLLIAKNNIGYKNLTMLTSLSQDNFHNKPHVSYDMLSEYSEGLISTTTCMGSEICQLLVKNRYEDAKRVAEQHIEFFGKDDFYVEIQRHGFEEELIVNSQLERLSRDLGLKIVATTDAHYPEVDGQKAHEILLCMGTKKKYDDPDRMQFPGSGYHLHEVQEVEKLFADLPEALYNTVEIAEKCKDLTLEVNENFLPHFPVPSTFDTEISYLRHLAKVGFDKRFIGTDAHTSAEYLDRLAFELDVIENMGFPGYFLIVQDFILWAKNQGILVGPGRGSAAGSLVAYSLQITDLDPIPFGLLFERFLNPDRISMPDIDVDFADDRRDEVIDYVKQKYGRESVSKIITFMKLAPRSAFSDVARTFKLSPKMVKEVTKLIPSDPKITLTRAFNESPEFRSRIESDPELLRVYEVALEVEGLPRNPSMHACGVIISPGPVQNFVPIVKIENKQTKIKETSSQFTMDEVEEVGLLKMDFLGLRTLTVIEKGLKLINKKRTDRKEESINYLDIPLDDPRVYQDIAKGETFGVFQLESGGMRAFMKDLFADAHTFKEPSIELFERLVAGVSLYRPGPMDYIPQYIENMRNPHTIVYDHEKAVDILKSTHGVIVYQEQAMQMVRAIANFTKGEADNVRKAFAKKKEEMIAPLRKMFMEGAIKAGVNEEIARTIWAKMEGFGEYALTKAN